MNEEELDTLPPTMDPMMACVERIEAKIDSLCDAVATLANEVQRLGRKDREHDRRAEFLEHKIRHLTPPAGMPAQNGNGGDRG